MTPEQKEILRKARGLLVEKGWTKYAMARKASGEPTWSGDPGACAYCLSGAVRAASGGIGSVDMFSVMDVLDELVPPKLFNSVTFNDAQTSVEPVLALIDRALGQ